MKSTNFHVIDEDHVSCVRAARLLGRWLEFSRLLLVPQRGAEAQKR